MRLVTFTHPETNGIPRLGVLDDQMVLEPVAVMYAKFVGEGADPATAQARVSVDVPSEMIGFFKAGPAGKDQAEEAIEVADRARTAGHHLKGPRGESVSYRLADVRLLAPVPRPPRVRDYLTYQGHADGSGLKVPQAFNEMPICYKCNVDSIIGPDDPIVWPAYTHQLDFELEVGFYVGRAGRNLTVNEASNAIAGVTIFNDVSARDIQRREMTMQIGPSKGKDFCSVMGPCVVTMDEIDEWAIDLSARINGETWTKGTTADRRYSFAEVLAWASYSEDVQPGEFLAVGTIAGGCGLELDRWIQPGDVVELASPQIGTLRNVVGMPEVTPEGAGLVSYSGAQWVTRTAH
jgi:2-keto-4-pentenoate hydratase/2-oxohepta-3-ene-1,7-dioic acid hydratase in catechol pathway